MHEGTVGVHALAEILMRRCTCPGALDKADLPLSLHCEHLLLRANGLRPDAAVWCCGWSSLCGLFLAVEGEVE